MNQQLEIAQAVKNLQDNMPAIIAKCKMDAKLHREKFLALVNEGFTESQALELCKATI